MDPLANAPSAATGEAPPGATISNVDLAAQLQARQEAKARRDYATADAIRFALERQHRVKVYDTTKSWIANDGRKGNTVGPNFFSLDGTSFAAGNQAPPISGSPRRFVGFVGSRNESFGRNEHIVSDAPAAAPPSPPAATASGSAGQAVPVVLDEPVLKSVAPPPMPPPPPPPRRVAHADVSQSPRSKLGAVMAPIITKSLAPTDDVQQQLDAVKSTLYTYEVAFESQNGYKPRTRAEWGEVWADHERHAALRKVAKEKEAKEEAAAIHVSSDATVVIRSGGDGKSDVRLPLSTGTVRTNELVTALQTFLKNNGADDLEITHRMGLNGDVLFGVCDNDPTIMALQGFLNRQMLPRMMPF